MEKSKKEPLTCSLCGHPLQESVEKLLRSENITIYRGGETETWRVVCDNCHKAMYVEIPKTKSERAQ